MKTAKIAFAVHVPDSEHYINQFYNYYNIFKDFYNVEDLFIFTNSDIIKNNYKNVIHSECGVDELVYDYLDMSDVYDVKITTELDCVPYKKIEDYDFKEFSIGSPFFKTVKWCEEHIKLFNPYLKDIFWCYECPLCYCVTGYEEAYKKYFRAKVAELDNKRIPESQIIQAAKVIFGDDKFMDFKIKSIYYETAMFSKKLRYHSEKVENLGFKLI